MNTGMVKFKSMLNNLLNEKLMIRIKKIKVLIDEIYFAALNARQIDFGT